MKKNKTVLITGATAGFGKACAEIFAANGYDLILTGRRNERLLELSQQLISSFGVEIQSLCFDVREENSVNEAIASIQAPLRENLSILINNAGLAVGKNPIHEGLTDDWNRMIDTNVKGLLYVSRAVIPILRENKTGHIINLGSIAGKEVYPDGNVYCATKHAVDALSKAMRMDLVKDGIKVTNIAPGAAETEFSMVRFKGDEQLANATYNGFDPLVAQDIAETIYFVATRPKHVTINDLLIMPTAQASATLFHKNE
jgi:3-hydroxy acid dehydrogenase / malonic semialdehyde reductase